MSRPPRPAFLLALLMLLPLAACGEANMDEQAKARTWDKNAFFPKNDHAPSRRRDRAAQRSRPGRSPTAGPPSPPPSSTRRERYAVFCVPCHGQDGRGVGMIVQRGLAPAGNLASEKVRKESGAEIYGAISNGYRSMFGMAQMIPPADRWAIVAYVRALQTSQDVPVASLPEADRAALEASR